MMKISASFPHGMDATGQKIRHHSEKTPKTPCFNVSVDVGLHVGLYASETLELSISINLWASGAGFA